jgi:hypothetical protein
MLVNMSQILCEGVHKTDHRAENSMPTSLYSFHEVLSREKQSIGKMLLH